MFMSLPVLSVALGAAVYKYFSRSGAAGEGEQAAVVVENASGSLTAWIPSVSYLDSRETDVEHIAMALSDAMKTTENLLVTYRCSDRTKEKIERTVNKICLLSTNERQGPGDTKSDGHPD